MKRIFIFLAVLTIIPSLALAQITLTAQQNRVFQLAASSYVSVTQTQMNNLNLNFRSQNDVTVMVNWLKIESAESGSLGFAFSDDVYTDFLDKYENFRYGTVSVGDSYAAPTNCIVSGSDIECDEPDSGTLSIFSWDAGTQLFTWEEVLQNVAGGKVTFANPGSGTYVVSLSASHFPCAFLTIP